MDIYTTIILIILAFAGGFIINRLIMSGQLKSLNLLSKGKEESFVREIGGLKDEIEKISDERADLLIKSEELNKELAATRANYSNLEIRNKEQKEEVEKLTEKFTKEFENLANKILEEKSEKFTEKNKENIKTILDPLQLKIKEFEQKVSDSQEKNIGLHASLKQQLETLQKQNLQITKEAENLTKALKGDSKTQGNWGELVLERVLEKSGLEKDREYFVQQSFLSDDGTRVIPDVIIHLPDNKKMIVDSKVSLTAYERYSDPDNEDSRELHLKEHLNSLKRHIEELSAKRYQDIYKMESPDFVLLFIPMDPAFAVALNSDNSLYEKAFTKNIVIVTPTTLLATLRVIDSMWTNQKQQENAYEIARLAGSLYDKFEGFVKNLDGIGTQIDRAKREYDAAKNKLVDGRGNIVITIGKLKSMGAKTQKSLPSDLTEKAEENHEKSD